MSQEERDLPVLRSCERLDRLLARRSRDTQPRSLLTAKRSGRDWGTPDLLDPRWRRTRRPATTVAISRWSAAQTSNHPCDFELCHLDARLSSLRCATTAVRVEYAIRVGEWLYNLRSCRPPLPARASRAGCVDRVRDRDCGVWGIGTRLMMRSSSPSMRLVGRLRSPRIRLAPWGEIGLPLLGEEADNQTVGIRFAELPHELLHPRVAVAVTVVQTIPAAVVANGGLGLA